MGMAGLQGGTDCELGGPLGGPGCLQRRSGHPDRQGPNVRVAAARQVALGKVNKHLTSNEETCAAFALERRT